MNTAFSSRNLLFTCSFIVSTALVLAGCLSGSNSNSNIVDFYVAPNGSNSNPGTISQPYLTIQKCTTTAVSGSTCHIRAGTYHETVMPNSGVIITSFNGESVTVDGTDPVTGWQPYLGSIYSASAAMSTGDTNQVFVGQQMMTEARWPNGDDLFHVNWATAQSGTTATQLMDSNLPNTNLAGASAHFWSGTDPWSTQTAVITTSSPGQLSLSLDMPCSVAYICPTSGGYYYLFGALGLLETQREWFYNTATRTLYFWAPGAVDPNTVDVRIKTRQYAFDLSGKSNVTIQNINLFASTINTDANSSSNTITGINASYLSHFTKVTGILSHAWDSGIILRGTGNSISNSTIAYSAGSGVVALGTNHIVKNNLIHHVDYIGNYGAGVLAQGNGHSIKNNTIHTTGRSAIYPSAQPNNLDISYNNLYNTMLLTRDGGAIYTSDQPGVVGSRIHHNWIHDTQPPLSGAASNYPLSGVYIDQDGSGWEVNQNVLWNNAYYNVLVHNPGGTNDTAPNNNNIHNNTIVDVAANSYIWLASMITCGTTQVVDNSVLTNVVNTGTACTVSNNNSTAPGATEMTSTVQVGCNFPGCSSSSPPIVTGGLVSASITKPPYGLTVSTGQPATFSVIGAGSGTLSYQWQNNGVDISGAIASSYTTPATTSADNGTAFSVTVSNSVGSVSSSSAILTVQYP